jgi:outer membrane protein TolC
MSILLSREAGMTIVARNLGKRLRAYGAILLTLVLLPCLATGQTGTPPPKRMTLDQALAYALEHYPAVRAALEQMSAARAGITLARTQYLPLLNGVYQDSRATENQVPGIWLPSPITPTVEGPVGPASGQSYWGSQAAMLFSWEPFDLGLRSATVGGAKSAADKSSADLAVTRLQVATAVGDYFLTALANQQARLAAQANLDRWKVFNKSVHVLAENQLRPGAEASRADAELSRAKTQLYLAQQAEQVALDTLAALMGAAGSDIGVDSGPLLDPPPAASLPEAASSAHPLARDEMAALRQVQAQEKVFERSDYPRFLLQAEGFGRGSEVPNNGTIIGDANGLAPARGNWVVGLTILFPDLFDLKALSAKKQIAQAHERAQQAHYQQTLQDLNGQILAARDQLKAAQLVAQETPTELRAARQTEIQSRARYEAGLTNLVEVAEAENLLAQAETQDALARLNLWRGLFHVAYAQGDLEPFLAALHTQAGRRP